MARTPFKRTDRVASLVRQVLGELITFEVKDPRVRGAAISDVEITGDLREARVFLIPPGDEREADALMAGLENASGFLRREVGQRIRLRVTPQLDFRYDHSIEYGNRIEQRLRELGLGDEPAPEVEDDDALDDTLDEAPAAVEAPEDDPEVSDGESLDEAFDGDSGDDGDGGGVPDESIDDATHPGRVAADDEALDDSSDGGSTDDGASDDDSSDDGSSDDDSSDDDSSDDGSSDGGSSDDGSSDDGSSDDGSSDDGGDSGGHGAR